MKGTGFEVLYLDLVVVHSTTRLGDLSLRVAGREVEAANAIYDWLTMNCEAGQAARLTVIKTPEEV